MFADVAMIVEFGKAKKSTCASAAMIRTGAHLRRPSTPPCRMQSDIWLHSENVFGCVIACSTFCNSKVHSLLLVCGCLWKQLCSSKHFCDEDPIWLLFIWSHRKTWLLSLAACWSKSYQPWLHSSKCIPAPLYTAASRASCLTCMAVFFAIERRSFGDLRAGSCWHVLCAPYLKHGRRMLADSCFTGWGAHMWAGLGYRISPGSCRLNQLSQELWSAERPCKSL